MEKDKIKSQDLSLCALWNIQEHNYNGTVTCFVNGRSFDCANCSAAKTPKDISMIIDVFGD
ncbi:MAG: hypothetical protein GY804_00655 [Alphaproteobacteria bacterium]|nr:hypothetical protein [Alphaproteobacteria bacterium]